MSDNDELELGEFEQAQCLNLCLKPAPVQSSTICIKHSPKFFFFFGKSEGA
jgi:hypothetical protein